MPTYRVIQDINSGDHPVGSEIELTEDEAAGMPWAVEAIAEAEPTGPGVPPEDPEAAFAKHVAETSVAKLVEAVAAIEDVAERQEKAFDILAVEEGSEKPRKTLISKLEEIISSRQGEGK